MSPTAGQLRAALDYLMLAPGGFNHTFNGHQSFLTFLFKTGLSREQLVEATIRLEIVDFKIKWERGFRTLGSEKGRCRRNRSRRG
jgi:hypothetical protein